VGREAATAGRAVRYGQRSLKAAGDARACAARIGCPMRASARPWLGALLLARVVPLASLSESSLPRSPGDAVGRQDVALGARPVGIYRPGLTMIVVALSKLTMLPNTSVPSMWMRISCVPGVNGCRRVTQPWATENAC
jgi:hypothetical protein